jgi:hypothetical protein
MYVLEFYGCWKELCIHSKRNLSNDVRRIRVHKYIYVDTAL